MLSMLDFSKRKLDKASQLWNGPKGFPTTFGTPTQLKRLCLHLYTLFGTLPTWTILTLPSPCCWLLHIRTDSIKVPFPHLTTPCPSDLREIFLLFPKFLIELNCYQIFLSTPLTLAIYAMGPDNSLILFSWYPQGLLQWVGIIRTPVNICWMNKWKPKRAPGTKDRASAHLVYSFYNSGRGWGNFWATVKGVRGSACTMCCTGSCSSLRSESKKFFDSWHPLRRISS